MEVLRRLRREYGYKLVTVASFHHNIGGGGPAGGVRPDGPDGAAGADDVPGATDADHPRGRRRRHRARDGGDAPDEADLAVVNRTRPGTLSSRRTGGWPRWSWARARRFRPPGTSTRRSASTFSCTNGT